MHMHVKFINSFTAIECPPLPAITNGLISYFPDVIPRFDLGTGANYTCDDGFYIDATDEARMCMDDNGNDAMGVWSGQELRCVGMLFNILTYTFQGN